MGSALTSEFVPYREDVKSAFDEMVRQLFSLHNYPFGHPAPDPQENPDQFESYFSEAGEDLIRCLEIIQLSPKRGPLMMGPLTADEVRSLFGTLQPTRSQIEDSETGDFLGRGEGIYCTVFDDGVATGLFFSWATLD